MKILSKKIVAVIMAFVMSLSLSYGQADSVKVLSPKVQQQQAEVSNSNVDVLVDGVVGVVGNTIILKSDIASRLQQLKQQGVEGAGNECFVWKEMLFQKLLVHKAEVDSLDVSDKEVDQEINRRLKYLLSQMGGSEVEFQKYFGKSVLEFKGEMRPLIKESLMSRKMQSKISRAVQVSPAEVTSYYKTIRKDSLPIIPEQYKIAQIIITPQPGAYEKNRVRKKLEKIRQEIIAGKDFGLMAMLHSEDPGSRGKRGELGFVSREQLVPAFSAAAFKLKPGEISDIVESEYGFHIIQLVEKKGTYINVRHILLTSKVYSTDLELCKLRVDSVIEELKSNPESFNKIASNISDDVRTKENGGVLMNYQTGDDYFTVDDLDEKIFFQIQKMKKKEISSADIVQMQGGKSAYRILYLMDKVEFHTASIETDYSKIKEAALRKKKAQVIDEWILSKIVNTYVQLPESCAKCQELAVWVKQANH